jgi:hypothetical protein
LHVFKQVMCFTWLCHFEQVSNKNKTCSDSLIRLSSPSTCLKHHSLNWSPNQQVKTPLSKGVGFLTVPSIRSKEFQDIIALKSYLYVKEEYCSVRWSGNRVTTPPVIYYFILLFPVQSEAFGYTEPTDCRSAKLGRLLVDHNIQIMLIGSWHWSRFTRHSPSSDLPCITSSLARHSRQVFLVPLTVCLFPA